MFKGSVYTESFVAKVYADADGSQKIEAHCIEVQGKLSIKKIFNVDDMEVAVPARFQTETACPVVILIDKKAQEEGPLKPALNSIATNLMFREKNIFGDVVLCFWSEDDDEDDTFRGGSEITLHNIIKAGDY